MGRLDFLGLLTTNTGREGIAVEEARHLGGLFPDQRFRQLVMRAVETGGIYPYIFVLERRQVDPWAKGPPTAEQPPSNEEGARMRKFALLLSGLLLAAAARGDVKPIQISLFSPTQLAGPQASIKGLRLNLVYGVNHDLQGLDVGLVNKLTGDLMGLQYGLVNMVDGDASGIQMGFVHLVEGDFSGWQDGFVSITRGNFVGFQGPAAYNAAGELNGFQFGLVNFVEVLNGLQIGLLNFNKSGEPHGFLPIVNFAF